MIRPSSGNGRNSAERAPTTTGAGQSATARQVSRRSACADVGVPLRREHAEALAEAVEPLRAEGDLGQQHQHLLSGGERCGECREIGLGLARPGDPVEHGHAEPAGGDMCRRAGARRPPGRATAAEPDKRQSGCGIAGGSAGARRSSTWPAAMRSRTTPARTRRAGRARAAAQRPPVAQRFEHPPARRGQTCPGGVAAQRREPGEGECAQPPRSRRLQRGTSTHRHAQDHAGRRSSCRRRHARQSGAARASAAEPAGVRARASGAQPAARRRPSHTTPNEAARPERYADEADRAQATPFRPGPDSRGPPATAAATAPGRRRSARVRALRRGRSAAVADIGGRTGVIVGHRLNSLQSQHRQAPSANPGAAERWSRMVAP